MKLFFEARLVEDRYLAKAIKPVDETAVTAEMLEAYCLSGMSVVVEGDELYIASPAVNINHNEALTGDEKRAALEAMIKCARTTPQARDEHGRSKNNKRPT